MNQKIRQGNPRYLQRILNLAGYNAGKVDGVIGAKTLAAIAAWEAAEQEAIRQYGKYDDRTESNLSTLIPAAQKAARQWLQKVMAWANENGLKVQIICGTRTYAEQDALYAQGRTTRGQKVTNARGGYSLHNFGLAFDLGIFRGGKYLESDSEYRRLHTECGHPQGYTWGGNWKSIVDCPHYQYAAYGDAVSTIRSKFER